MSYDVALKINTGKGLREVMECGNYTYNCSAMLVLAIGKSLSAFDGCPCPLVEEELTDAIDKMKSHPARYEELEPSNGWGSYEGWLKYLCIIRDACASHPLCTLSVF